MKSKIIRIKYDKKQKIEDAIKMRHQIVGAYYDDDTYDVLDDMLAQARRPQFYVYKVTGAEHEGLVVSKKKLSKTLAQDVFGVLCKPTEDGVTTLLDTKVLRRLGIDKF